MLVFAVVNSLVLVYFIIWFQFCFLRFTCLLFCIADLILAKFTRAHEDFFLNINKLANFLQCPLVFAPVSANVCPTKDEELQLSYDYEIEKLMIEKEANVV